MAVAAVASVCQILETTLHHQHLILHNRQEIASLLEEVSLLQDSLNNKYSSSAKSSEIIESLEGEIIRAAHKARDFIQSCTMEQLIRETSQVFTSTQLLNQVATEIVFIDKEVRKIQQDCGVPDPRPRMYRHRLLGNMPVDYSWIIQQLFYQSDDKLRTLSIVGMAGIGKTTIAKQASDRLLGHVDYGFEILVGVNYGFEIGAWATVGQIFSIRDIVIDLLVSINMFTNNEMHQDSTEMLGEYLHRSLKGRRFFLVLDDVWDTKVWDDLIRLLPDENNRSRILLTTRSEEVALYTNSYPRPYHMNFVQHIRQCQYVLLQNEQQAQLLLNNASPLQDILQIYSHKGNEKAKSLDNQITEAAKKLKDLTESCIIDYNLTFSHQCLMEVKREICFVKQCVMKFEEAENSAPVMRPRNMCLFKSIASSVVGLHEDFMEIRNRVAGGSPRLEVISLIGMGGIGKTTLARQVYRDKFILEFFLIHAWITVSQSYDLKQILIGLLDSIKEVDKSSSIEELAEHLYKSLKGRRYMLVIDDVWDNKLWDDLRQLFPNDKNSSRILLTTRLENVAVYANSSYLHHMPFLDGTASWKLFCNKVFGEDCCPPELNEIGKTIVQNCGGLPLGIIVVGGFLLRGSRTQHYWRNIAENLSSGLISSDDRCSKILTLSYTELPQHLKECFLFTGIFPEDFSIRVSKLIKLWIAEGFLEPLKSDSSLEDIAYEYLLDLVDRSLVMVDKWSSTRRIKTCKIHDIVRDFCMRKAKKEILCHITDGSLSSIPVGTNVRLLSIHSNATNMFPYDEKKLSSLLVTSCYIFDPVFQYLIRHLNPRPLRVLDSGKTPIGFNSKVALNKLISHNLRYLAGHSFYGLSTILSPIVCSNLQTLILDQTTKEVPIWSMPQLRHVKVKSLYLSDPLEREIPALVLENLQTITMVVNLRWSMEVLQRIPNVKNLGISYDWEHLDWQYYCLNNLAHLDNLESLRCYLSEPEPFFLHMITFPHSLKKLTLLNCGLPWKYMVIVGALPNLEVLKLKDGAFEGQDWESTEDQFSKLKYLLLDELNLEEWRADADHFPRLQHLVIRRCKYLKVIHSCIGEIQTLQSIELKDCADSLVDSVKEIKQEQQDFGNDILKIRIQGYKN